MDIKQSIQNRIEFCKLKIEEEKAKSFAGRDYYEGKREAFNWFKSDLEFFLKYLRATEGYYWKQISPKKDADAE